MIELGLNLAQRLEVYEKPLGVPIEPHDVVEFQPEKSIPFSALHWAEVSKITRTQTGLDDVLWVREYDYPNRPPKERIISAESVARVFAARR